MESITLFLDTQLWNNTVRQWLIAAGVGAAAFVVMKLVLRVVCNRLESISKRTKAIWDDVVVHTLRKTSWAFLLVVAISAASSLLTLPGRNSRLIALAAVLAFLIQAGIWITSGLGIWLDRYGERQRERGEFGSATTVTAMVFAAKLLAWTLVLLVALDNFGIDVTALIAGLGIGGIAIALALQNILKDLFASLSIVLDKPFVLGDFLIVDDHMGNVEHIGLKTTRIRSLWGEQVVFSNNDLLSSRLRNFGRMAQRRVIFGIGVTYQTPRDKLIRIPEIIREAITSQSPVRFDRSHFKNYGDFSLNFESVYYVLASDFNTYMDVQQAVNLRIHERFEEEGIEFAYPTQTVFLEKVSA
ncbi:MAG: mechanosensitive ion channel family protein [Gemmatimonadaceae bacterium]